MNKEFKLPDVGEGLTEADIVSWHVKPGDTIQINQVIVEIETAKAVVELPSPYAGTVTALLAAEGETVDVGRPIIAVEVPGPDTEPGPAPAQPAATKAAEPDAGEGGETAQPARRAVLVGYGAKPGATTRRPRKSPSTRPASYPPTTSAPPTSMGADPPGGVGGRAVPPRGG